MPAFNRAAFYFVAHADDWQLFMMPEIGNDIADKECKLCIVHITAGEAGLEDAFWKAREQGSIDSLLFRLSTDEQIHRQSNDIIAANKKIHTQVINNCACYFLRLPDGNADGGGFPAYGNQSLQKLENGSIPFLDAVDKSAVYATWQELAGTIDDIINMELNSNGPIANVQLNFPEYDEALSPFDHNDHYHTAKLVQQTKAYNNYSKRAFVHYNTINSTNFLINEELFWKIGMFSAYHQAVYKQYGHSTIAEDRSFIPWCFRSSSCRNL